MSYFFDPPNLASMHCTKPLCISQVYLYHRGHELFTGPYKVSILSKKASPKHVMCSRTIELDIHLGRLTNGFYVWQLLSWFSFLNAGSENGTT